MANKSMVNISAATLNALKQMLFSNENGVNLTTVINDLSSGLNQNADLVAINVGLSYKGITPEIDKTTRYDDFSEYWRQFRRFEFISYSLILDMVKVKPIEITRKKDADEWEEKELEPMVFTLEHWMGMTTSPDEYVKKINEKYPLPETPQEAAI
jgi:hypothetical protein